jgi:hypothetical protein
MGTRHLYWILTVPSFAGCDALPTFHVAEKITPLPPLSPVKAARQHTDQDQFSTNSLLPLRQKTVVDLEVVQKAWIAHAFH